MMRFSKTLKTINKSNSTAAELRGVVPSDTFRAKQVLPKVIRKECVATLMAENGLARFVCY